MNEVKKLDETEIKILTELRQKSQEKVMQFGEIEMEIIFLEGRIDEMLKMKDTFNLSLELNTLGWNAYAAMALPGSELYKHAIEMEYPLPSSYEGYSFHSYSTLPLPTKHLKPSEILNFRDQCFNKYHLNKAFLSKIEKKFGNKAVKNITDSAKIKLKRKIIEEDRANNEI